MANQENLYSGEEYFFLIIAGISYRIDEPVNWVNILISIIRDAVYGGFNYEFIGGDVELTFAFKGGGGELLKDHYNIYKGDARAMLEFGTIKSATREQQFLGDLNFNDYNLNDEGVVLTASKTAFEALLRTRMETNVSLSDLADLDGNPLPALATTPILLHSKEIVKLGQALTATPSNLLIDPNLPGPPDQDYSKRKYLQPDTTNITISELKEIKGEPLGVSNTDPTTISLYQYKAEEAGYLEVNMQFSGYINIENAGANPTSVDFTPFLMVKRTGIVIQTIYFSALKQTVFNYYGAGIAGLAVYSVSVEVNDEIYLGIQLDSSGSVVRNFKGIGVSNWSNKIDFKQLTVAAASVVQAYKLFDVLERVVYAATGKPGRVISNLYGPGGPAERFVITNGYALRNFTIDGVATAKPVQVALKTLVDSLQAIHNSGMGYQLAEDGDIVTFHQFQDYFPAGEIIKLSGVYDYTEKHHSAGTYNELVFGYNKFPDSKENTLDEFNTVQNWLTPIKSYKAILSRISKLIASGYSIEESRREQFKETPSTSLPNDDELFIIAYTDDITYEGVSFQFFAADASIKFDKELGMSVDDTFTIAGALINTGTFTVTGRKYGEREQYFISPTPTDEALIGVVTIVPFVANGNPAGLVFAERNQHFTLSNVISPGSVYNVRITPHKMLYNASPLLNSFLSAKADTEVIKNTLSKNNGDFTSMFLPGTFGALQTGLLNVTEKADVILSEMPAAPIHSGTIASFKVLMPYSDVNIIMRALRSPTVPRRGFIVVADAEAHFWYMQINSMKYNPTTQAAEIEAYKVARYL